MNASRRLNPAGAQAGCQGGAAVRGGRLSRKRGYTIISIMQLQVGVGSFKELEYYIEHGAAELYCGLYGVPNHVEGARNFTAPAEVGEAAALAHSAGRRLYFAANEVHAEGLEATAAILKDLAGRGVDGFIIKDLSLLGRVRGLKAGKEIILSTLACCMNAGSLGFYAGLGVTRMALPEQLTPQEARELVKNRLGVGTEVFHKAQECCRNFNGLCFLDCHGLETNVCRKEYRAGRNVFVMPALSPAQHLAELHDYYKMGVGTLKIGRSPDAADSRLIFAEARALLKLLDGGIDKKEFVRESLRMMTAYHRARGTIMGEKRWKKR